MKDSVRRRKRQATGWKKILALDQNIVLKISKLSNTKTNNNFKNWQTTEHTFHQRRHRHTWEKPQVRFQRAGIKRVLYLNKMSWDFPAGGGLAFHFKNRNTYEAQKKQSTIKWGMLVYGWQVSTRKCSLSLVIRKIQIKPQWDTGHTN